MCLPDMRRVSFIRKKNDECIAYYYDRWTNVHNNYNDDENDEDDVATLADDGEEEEVNDIESYRC